MDFTIVPSPHALPVVSGVRCLGAGSSIQVRGGQGEDFPSLSLVFPAVLGLGHRRRDLEFDPQPSPSWADEPLALAVIVFPSKTGASQD